MKNNKFQSLCSKKRLAVCGPAYALHASSAYAWYCTFFVLLHQVCR